MEESKSESKVTATPFEEFTPGQKSGARQSLHCGPIASVLRILSGLALACALIGALAIVFTTAAGSIHPVAWKIKSAYPLMAIGISYALLQFTIPRTLAELSLSLAVSAAFFLWGAEQFIHDPRITALIDAFVVVLFVSDLGIVIQDRLRRANRPKSHPPT